MRYNYYFLITVKVYHNGYGIIAAGKGTARIEDKYYVETDNYEDDERNMLLRNFIHGVNIETEEIDKYIEPSRIKELLERDFFFPNTIVTLTEDEAKKLFEECQIEFNQITV